MESLDAHWQTHAAPLLGSPTEEFLLILAGAGSIGEGWFRVNDPMSTHLPSRVASVIGRPEFMALSQDGARLCAVSLEDDEYWVITHEFSDHG
jgi:hypothetical protein